MAEFYHRVETWTRELWIIPHATHGGIGAPIVEMYRAIASAEERFQEIYGRTPQHDDWLRMWAADDEIILFFDTNKDAS